MAPNTEKSQTDPNRVIVGISNTPLSQIERSSRNNNKKPRVSNTMSQMDLTNIYRTLLPNTKEYTFFFSVAHRAFSNTNHR